MPKRTVVDDDHEKVILKEPHNRLLIEKKRRKTKEKKEEETVEIVVAKYDELDQASAVNFTSFDKFPLSQRTLKGLKDAGFVTPTDIQRQSLGHSIIGGDVIGSAKTGSGKTLALIIPLLECLFRNRWTKFDGLGALVICPTRELSYQIFQVLNTVGAHHEFSAALLIGGTDVEYEKKRLSSMNIIICTPGRLLQHMDENESFACDQLQILIIDEADRILDMGFRKQMDSIIENLPKERQTLLFSATQTKKVEDLSRVSLTNPVDVAVHEHDSNATPDQLEQARYYTESFRHLKPGLSLMGLWGSLSQTKRMETFHKFNSNTHGAAMIATDVASRGLDFQNVDWVLQLDCPADVDDYIHRVGRTARFENKGSAALVLTPSQEEVFIKLCKEKRIPITKVEVDNRYMHDIRLKLSNIMVPFPQLKDFAQKSFVAYARAIYFMKLKSVFDVKSINFQELAASYGLPMMPRIRFLKKQGLMPANRPHDFTPKPEKKESDGNVDEVVLAEDEDNVPSSSRLGGDEKPREPNECNDDKDDFLQVKRRDVFNVLKGATVDDEIDARILRKDRVITKQQMAKKILRRGIKLNKHLEFNNGDEEEEGKSNM